MALTHQLSLSDELHFPAAQFEHEEALLPLYLPLAHDEQAVEFLADHLPPSRLRRGGLVRFVKIGWWLWAVGKGLLGRLIEMDGAGRVGRWDRWGWWVW